MRAGEAGGSRTVDVRHRRKLDFHASEAIGAARSNGRHRVRHQLAVAGGAVGGAAWREGGGRGRGAVWAAGGGRRAASGAGTRRGAPTQRARPIGPRLRACPPPAPAPRWPGRGRAARGAGRAGPARLPPGAARRCCCAAAGTAAAAAPLAGRPWVALAGARSRARPRTPPARPAASPACWSSRGKQGAGRRARCSGADEPPDPRCRRSPLPARPLPSRCPAPLGCLGRLQG